MIIRRRKRKRRKNPRTKRRLNVLQTRKGKQALRRHNRFWGLKGIPKLKTKAVPGIKDKEAWVGLGRSPGIVIANGPNPKKATKIKLIKAAGELVADHAGRRMIWLRNRRKKSNGKLIKRFLGWVKKSIYIPYRDIEKAGSSKSKTEWHHEHGAEERGKWPKAFIDQNGNIHYSKGTYRVAAKSDARGIGWIQH